MSTSALVKRKARLRLPQTDLVRMTGLDKTTVNKALAGSHDPRSSTVDRIAAALTREEIAMRDYLLALHPIVDDVPASRPFDGAEARA